MLSFNMPPARDLAAPAARSGNGLPPTLTRRDANANSASQPAAQEVSIMGDKKTKSRGYWISSDALI